MRRRTFWNRLGNDGVLSWTGGREFRFGDFRFRCHRNLDRSGFSVAQMDI